MSKPTTPWSDSARSGPLERMLHSAESRAGDAAALERMCARLETSLGAEFDARPTWRIAPSQLQRFISIGVVTVAAISITYWGLRPATPRQPLQPVAASVQVALQPAAAIQLASPADEAAPASQPLPKHPAQSHKPRKAPGLAEELNGLDQIRVLLASSPERALAAADAQQQRFAHGALTPERELLRLDALLRMGRVAQARKLAQQLMAAPENRAYAARITQLLARRP